MNANYNSAAAIAIVEKAFPGKKLGHIYERLGKLQKHDQMHLIPALDV